MNRRTAKLLNRHAAYRRHNPNEAKKAWLKTPRPARYRIREAIKAELEQVE